MVEITLTNLRKSLFKTVDAVLETGEQVVIRRKGRRLVLREESETPDISYLVLWRRYVARGRREDEPDLSFEEIEQALAEARTWDEEPELDT